MRYFIFLALLLFACEEPREVYETEIKNYVVSSKKEDYVYRGPIKYYIYFQTPTSTECAKVSVETYNSYQVGDKISVLIKYWEKPKKK